MKTACTVAAIAALAGSAMAQTFSFSGTGGAIPDNNAAGINSSVMSTASGPITDVTVDIFGLSHTWVGDLIITLSQSGGPTATLMFRNGSLSGTTVGDSTNLGGDYTFANSGADIWAAAAALPTGGVIAGGTYAASGLGSGAPNNAFAAFNGLDAGGEWTLNIADRAGLDFGSFQGWQLNVTVVPTPATAGLLGLGGLVAVRRRR